MSDNLALASLSDDRLILLLRAVASERCTEFKGAPEDCCESEAANRIARLTARVAELEAENGRLKIARENYWLDAENQRHKAESAERERDELRDALVWVLPMARSHAYANPVGSNLELIKHAETVLDGAALAAQEGGNGERKPKDGATHG